MAADSSTILRRLTMRINRRSFLSSAPTLWAAGVASARQGIAADTEASFPRVTNEELDRAAAERVLKVDTIKSPIVIESIKLLKREREYFVHVRSKDGAEGISLTNPPRAEYLDKVLKDLVIPFFINKDARNLE